MSNGLLFPSNIQRLSDGVIGVVVARRPKLSDRVFEEESVCAPIQAPSSAEGFHSEPLSSSGYNDVVPAPYTAQYQQQLTSNQERVDPYSNLSTAEKLLLLRRAQRRRIQQRYRKKVKDKENALAQSVDQLRRQLQQLQAQVALGCFPRGATNSIPQKQVVEFFRLFRDGLELSRTALEQQRDSPVLLCLGEDHAQARFVQGVMAPDVMFNEGRGVEAVLEDWRLRALYHDKIEIQLTSIEEGPEGLLIARIRGYTTITERMLRDTSPNVDADVAEGTNQQRLARKLLGNQLVIPGSVRFEWDKADGHFVRVCYNVDMLTPLMKLLGNLEEALRVLNSPLGIP